MKTGTRFEQVELSTIDTTLLLAGALFCQSLLRPATIPRRRRSARSPRRSTARVIGTGRSPEPPRVSMGWHPEKGFIDYEWLGYNEAMILYVLALGSPTHPIDPADWEAWTRTYHWGPFYGQEHVNFAPLFGHQYSHVWIDFRGIQRRATCAGKGIDYFENSRRATLSQRAYAIDNPRPLPGLRRERLGAHRLRRSAGRRAGDRRPKARFMTYAARGAAPASPVDDGTIAPTAAGLSIAFAPEVAIPAMEEMHRRWGEHLWAKYGFLDSFNPSFDRPTCDAARQGGARGRLVRRRLPRHRPGADRGDDRKPPSGLIWRSMRRNPHIGAG